MTAPATISREELYDKIQRREPLHLFEVLPKMYWRKHHLPGAISLPLEDVEAKITTFVPNKADEIVVYCWDYT